MRLVFGNIYKSDQKTSCVTYGFKTKKKRISLPPFYYKVSKKGIFSFTLIEREREST